MVWAAAEEGEYRGRRGRRRPCRQLRGRLSQRLGLQRDPGGCLCRVDGHSRLQFSDHAPFLACEEVPSTAFCDRPASINAPLTASPAGSRSEEHTSELQSLMRIPYAVFCLKKKQKA